MVGRVSPKAYPVNCAATHGPTVAAMSSAITALEAGTEPFCDNAGMCPTEVVRRFGARAVENSVFCDVMCCCRTATGSGARQRCVQKTLDAADQALAHQSRYKAEISYNMTTVPPSPFMHRDGSGLKRSDRWQTRAQDEIPGCEANEGMVRRPDIVVVRNPNRPPTQDNIERVVEMKFRGDPDDPKQMAAYQAIAGPGAPAEIRREENCDCGNENRRRIPFPVPAPAPQDADRVVPVPIPVEPERAPAPVPDTDGVPASTWVIVGLGLATAAAIVFPFDGPAGDVALGSAFLAALGTQ